MNSSFDVVTFGESLVLFAPSERENFVLIPSVAEAEIMTGLNGGESMLDALLSLGPPQVVLKAGDKGAWYANGAERGFCPCHSVPEIDPVGAGDAFCAGVLSGLLDGQPLAGAVRRGAALGAFCVSKFGDYQGLPERAGLEAFMEGSSIPGR